MAKLNVVIPAVEVTVDGVTYRKVDRKAQAGDIVKALESDLDIDKGAFYGPVTGADTDCVEFTDNVGDQRRRGSGSYEVYAPISEPAAETKPDTITFQGAEWRKVDRDVRKGDAIRFTDEDRSSYLTESELYVVDRVDGADDPQITDDDGDSYDAYVDNYEVYEKVVETSAQEYHEVKRKADVGERIKIVAATENGGYYENGDILTVSRADRWQGAGSGMSISAEGIGIAIYHSGYVVLEPVTAEPTQKAEPERLVAGDYARVVEPDHHAFDYGDIVEVIGTDSSSVPYHVKQLVNGRDAWAAASRLVRATDEEVAAAKDSRSQFAAGDKVRLISGGGERFALDYTNGGVYTVKNPKYDSSKSGIQITGGGQLHAYVGAEQLVKLTAEEVADIERKQAEEKRWAAIGRNINVFKVGDIVECKADSGRLVTGDIGEVGELKGDVQLRVNTREHKRVNWTSVGYVKLIVPVEQRFDRPSSESAVEEVDAA